MRRREALGRILGAAALPLVGASCDFERLLQPDFAAGDAGFATLIGAGDLHATNVALVPRRRTAALVKKVLDADPAAMAFMVGDLTHNGTRAELDQWYAPTWGVFQSRTIFTIGNHDVDYATPRGAGYYGYTGAPGYQATTLGSWRVYSLNCFPATRGGVDQAAQMAWLQADLAENPAKQLAAFFHYPMFSSVCEYHTALHNGVRQDMTWKGRIGPWWKLLQSAGCSFAVSGHAHRYERLLPMLADGTVSDAGIRQFVCGTAGVKLRNIVPPPHPASEKIVVAHGVVRFDLYPDRYEWTFTDEFGVVSDQGTQACRKVLA